MEMNKDLSGYYNEENMGIVEEFCAIAREMQCTPSQVATAWVAAKPAVSSVIVGVKKMEHLEDVLKTADLVLTEEQMKKIDSLTDYTVQNGLGWDGYRNRQLKKVDRFAGK